MQLYKHISSCELCACAVNGFTALPFASDDLVAIHREIDVRVNATAVNSLAISRVLIVTASLMSLIAVNFLCDTRSEKIVNKISIDHKSQSQAITKNETKEKPKEEIFSVTKAVKEDLTMKAPQRVERDLSAIERLDLIKPNGIGGVGEDFTGSDLITLRAEKNIIYLYDLKISDYYNLYFRHTNAEADLFKTHTPVYKENKKSLGELFEDDQSVTTADRMLKQALKDYSKQKFIAAQSGFETLLGLNPDDVNAQFYSALTYYNLSQPQQALESFERVMENSNTSFYQEAEWLSALINLKLGNREEARSVFSKIIQEKGFYSKRASERYKGL
jgi:TolA-binding protein